LPQSGVFLKSDGIVTTAYAASRFGETSAAGAPWANGTAVGATTGMALSMRWASWAILARSGAVSPPSRR